MVRHGVEQGPALRPLLKRLGRLPVGWLAVAGSFAYGILLLLVRGRPTIDLDAGIFLSVAARLLDGDRLYSGVFDNKDPLFYYADAAALWVGGWRGPFLLDVLWLTIAAASVVALLRALGAPLGAVVAGFAAYPLLLTGEWYYAGYSLLASLALAPLVAWLWVRGSLGWAGAALGAALLFRASLLLVLVSAPVALLLVRPTARAARGQIARAGAGVGVVAAAAAIALAARGELVPYVNTEVDNVGYSNRVLVDTGRRSGIVGHVRAVAGATEHYRLVVALFFVTALIAVWTLVRTRRAGALGAASRALAALYLAATVTTTVTLGLTAAWDHHVQMLAYPGVLLIAFLVTFLLALRPAYVGFAGALAALGVGLVLIGGTRSSPGASAPISTWFSAVHSDTADALEEARARWVPGRDPVTYAHLGQNDELAHAAFLDRGFRLACAVFHQYTYTGNLTGVLRCVERKRPELILVTSSFSLDPTRPARWNDFVASGRRLLERLYVQELVRPSLRGPVEVWKLHAGESAPTHA